MVEQILPREESLTGEWKISLSCSAIIRVVINQGAGLKAFTLLSRIEGEIDGKQKVNESPGSMNVGEVSC